MAKILTVYFSKKGQTIDSQMKIEYLEKGNTAIAAEFVQKAVGGDLFEIEADKTYPEDYTALIGVAKRELNGGVRVPVKNYPDISAYDIVFVGYPNWWNTMPMVTFTFLEHCDWEGKKIIPFCTNEGSGLGNSVRDIQKICAGADVAGGLSILGSQVKNSEKKISEWAKNQLN